MAFNRFRLQNGWHSYTDLCVNLSVFLIILTLALPQIATATSSLRSPTEEMKKTDWREEEYLRARHVEALASYLMVNKGQQTQDSLDRIDFYYTWITRIIDAYALLESLHSLYEDTTALANYNQWKNAAEKLNKADPGLLAKYGATLSSIGIEAAEASPDKLLLALSWTAFLTEQAASKGVLDTGVLNLNLANKDEALLDLARTVTQDNIEDNAAWYEKAITWTAVQKVVLDSMGEIPAALKGYGGATGFGTIIPLPGSLVKFNKSYWIPEVVKIVTAGIATHYVINANDELQANALAMEFLTFYYCAYRGNKHAIEVALGKPDNQAFSWSLRTLVWNFLKSYKDPYHPGLGTFEQYYTTSPTWIRALTASTGPEPLYKRIVQFLQNDPNLMWHYAITPVKTYSKTIPTNFRMGETIAIKVQLDPLLESIDSTASNPSTMLMSKFTSVAVNGVKNDYTANFIKLFGAPYLEMKNVTLNSPLGFTVAPLMEATYKVDGKTTVLASTLHISRKVALDPTWIDATQPTVVSAIGKVDCVDGSYLQVKIRVPETPFAQSKEYDFHPSETTPLEVCLQAPGYEEVCVTATAPGQELTISKLPVSPYSYYAQDGDLPLKIRMHLHGYPLILPFTSVDLEKTYDYNLAWSAIDRQSASPVFQLVIADTNRVGHSRNWTSVNLIEGETIKVCFPKDNDLWNIGNWPEAEIGFFPGSNLRLIGTVEDGCVTATATESGWHTLSTIIDRNGSSDCPVVILENFVVTSGLVASLPGSGDPGGISPGTGETTATQQLNDTGLQYCGNAAGGTNLPCSSNTNPKGQDAFYGRDAAAAAGVLTKKGGGSAAFDYTKISNNGGELPSNAALGSGSNDWACTRDNVTGLMWEVKTDNNGLRDKDWTYTWYNSDPNTNGGAVGTVSGGTCYQTGRCDTEKYVIDVNSQGLCGRKDWRLPKVKELVSIVDYSRTDPPFDPVYFPNSKTNGFFWSGEYSIGEWNWSNIVAHGSATAYPRKYDRLIRLVNNAK
jgi:hypothetical protein